MNDVYAAFENDLDNTLDARGVTPDSTFADSIARVGLVDEIYNTSKGVIPVSAFGVNAGDAFAVGDMGGVAFQTAFFTNRDKVGGLALRRTARHALWCYGADMVGGWGDIP